MAPIARMPVQPPADLFISRTPPPQSTPAATPEPGDSTQRSHPAPPRSGPTEPESQAGPGRESSEGQRIKAEPCGNYNHHSNFDSNYGYNNNEKPPQLLQPRPTTLHHIEFVRAKGHGPRPEQTDALARGAREFYNQGLEHQRQRRLRRRLVLLFCFHGLAVGAAVGCRNGRN
ncbi:predicted protein [Chaetomium globosum CBS 148.51]|uniref:Uncharacterized protein n=1 Tax=Chaetomium globosum (strain ATCC 6205 / CBS 148.51 / DSM 1962 / NBRC 6347 / NRRL 1970) TaxID=306901 RepID=Q2GPS2_CHAGB|nr:uncharacterized protein CHGG_10032 [Chaetomium globosum CBS 148.51]EAQ83628.1 predicted protein [Chaetomium globosum CBS 148.51]